MAALKISLLGGFEALNASGEPILVGGRKLQALLALLAMKPGAPHPREKLTALLWGDRAEEQARGSLRQALAELRRALNGVDPMPVVADRESVVLDAAAVEVDVAAFERAISQGGPDALVRAAELYRGDLLDGLTVVEAELEEWLRDERIRLRERASDAFSRLLDGQASMGDTEAAITTARRLLALDPMQEAVHRTLMRLYVRKGDRLTALRQYQACRDLLRIELGLDPEAETETLVGEIRSGAVAAEESAEPATANDPSIPTMLPLPDKPSIAVLPFTNMSGDPEQEYFSDGLTEDIITELSKFRTFFVIARNSSFAFKGQTLDVKQISSKLGVRYIVEGSVRRAGSRVRISAQLIDASEDRHIWAQRYDRDLEDMFAVQDEVTLAIVTAIEPQLAISERKRSLRKPPESLDAWESYQRGLWHTFQYKPQDRDTTLAFFGRAIEIDPTFASAYAGLGYAHYVYLILGASPDRKGDIERAFEAGQTAVRLDEHDPFAWVALTRGHMLRAEHEAAITVSDTAISLNPNFALAHFGRAHALWHAGRPSEAIASHDEAMRLCPLDPMMWAYLASKAIALVMLGEFEEAIAISRRAQRQAHSTIFSHLAEISALGHLERSEEAGDAIERARERKPDVSVAFVNEALPITDPRCREIFLGGLRKAGLAS